MGSPQAEINGPPLCSLNLLPTEMGVKNFWNIKFFGEKSLRPQKFSQFFSQNYNVTKCDW